MKNEPKAFLGRAATLLVSAEAPLKGFIFPVDFEEQSETR
jgi:hypothetical protein